MNYKSCQFLENSLYLAPNEIRACCQRYFYKGKIRGDAVLLKTFKNKKISSQDILIARKSLFERIQKNKEESCLGCPFLKKKKNSNITQKSNFLSIEHHSFCNLRCTYCSDVYYGGKKPDYDVVDFLKNYGEEGNLKDCNQVVWGGGEPTLDKNFKKILLEINKIASPKIYHRVFTNSIVYKEVIKEFLDQDLIKIVTSIDAGTPETFLKIRGKNKFYEVLENLKKYSLNNSGKITIKYILTEGNQSENELEKFVQNCIKYELSDCCFQISLNYKYDKLKMNYFQSVVMLFSKLIVNNIKKVFLDDHILARFSQLNAKEIEDLNNFLQNKKINNVIIDPKKIESIIIFGAGKLTDDLVTKAKFFKTSTFDIFDSDVKKIGNKFFNKIVKNPLEIKNDDRPIYISAAQSYEAIYKYLKKIKKDKNVISGIFI